ncbi:phytanoyl-CoA dioxygenase family protein [Denitrobaculum tricleocarpae]|uniref:Phytanoyl-CoA dioxygenase family protein n=1 Tax=Denitrobaculum tricleocarpae TaxID=2591009 RepID=A0A545T3T7_9PROT|nr:phytanoyl-CoA dioxygenase family protein [Denitrobaculum tricleocarpae]TQV71876.1 phytanoyl-CoA dioxygenase family protein [Denitrobaculum tricleocarpae]
MTLACDSSDSALADLRNRFDEQGFVILPKLLAPEQLAALRADVAAVFSARADVSNHGRGRESLDETLQWLFENDFEGYLGAAKLCNHLISLHRLGTSDELVESLKMLGLEFPAICARPLMWFHSRRLAKTERYHRLPAHQEWSNMQGSLDGAVAWLPLVEVSPEMGRLQVIPGSHRDGLLPFAPDDEADYPLALSRDAVREEDFVEVEVPLGSVLFFSSFLVHRSGTNTTDRTRLTVNFRYNNALESSFVERSFINPFSYAAPEKLIHPDFPGPGRSKD